MQMLAVLWNVVPIGRWNGLHPIFLPSNSRTELTRRITVQYRSGILLVLKLVVRFFCLPICTFNLYNCFYGWASTENKSSKECMKNHDRSDWRLRRRNTIQ